MNNTTRFMQDIKEIELQQIVYKFYNKKLNKIILDYKGTINEYDSIKKLDEEMCLWHVSKLKSTFELKDNILYIYIK